MVEDSRGKNGGSCGIRALRGANGVPCRLPWLPREFRPDLRSLSPHGLGAPGVHGREGRLNSGHSGNESLTVSLELGGYENLAKFDPRLLLDPGTALVFSCSK